MFSRALFPFFLFLGYFLEYISSFSMEFVFGQRYSAFLNTFFFCCCSLDILFMVSCLLRALSFVCDCSENAHQEL